MPKVKFSPLIEEIEGTLHDMVFKKSPQGKIIVTKRPDISKVKWSKAQKAQRKRWAAGVASIQLVLKDPRVRARYERKAKKQGKRA